MPSRGLSIASLPRCSFQFNSESILHKCCAGFSWHAIDTPRRIALGADFTPALFDWTLNNITCKPQNHSAWRLDLISACSVCQYSLPVLDSERFWCAAGLQSRTNLFIDDYAIKLKRLLINLQNGFIECEKDCPAVDDCYALVKKSPEICCDKCKGKFAFDRLLSIGYP